MGCGRPWAQETGGNSRVRCNATPKPKLISIGFSQRVWKMIPAEALTKKGLWFRPHLQAFHEDSKTHTLTCSWRSITSESCFNKHAKCRAHSALGQRKVDWCTWSFYWKIQNGVLWGSPRNHHLHSCRARTHSWCHNQSNVVVFHKETVELEGTHTPHGQLFQQ